MENEAHIQNNYQRITMVVAGEKGKGQETGAKKGMCQWEIKIYIGRHMGGDLLWQGHARCAACQARVVVVERQ